MDGWISSRSLGGLQEARPGVGPSIWSRPSVSPNAVDARSGCGREVGAVLAEAPASGWRAAGQMRARQLADDRIRGGLYGRTGLGGHRDAGRGRCPRFRGQALDVADGAIVAVHARIVAVPERRGAVQRQGEQGEHSEDSLAASWNHRFRSISHHQKVVERRYAGRSL